MGLIIVPASQDQRLVVRNEWDDSCQGFRTMVTSTCSSNARSYFYYSHYYHAESFYTLKSLTTKKGWKLKWNNLTTYQIGVIWIKSSKRRRETERLNFWFIWFTANIRGSITQIPMLNLFKCILGRSSCNMNNYLIVSAVWGWITMYFYVFCGDTGSSTSTIRLPRDKLAKDAFSKIPFTIKITMK